jgi:hypothetical protein
VCRAAELAREDVGVTLELSADEALVLFEWLARTSDAGHPMPFADEAERRVLDNVLCLLERVLVEPFSAQYDSLLEAARSRLNDGFSVDQ